MVLYIVVAILCLFLAAGMALSWFSHSGEPNGLLEGHLSACPGTPNCVCSEYQQPEVAFVEPLYFEGDVQRAWAQAQETVTMSGGKISRLGNGYLAATFTTPLFRFVDDVELRLDTAAGVIHIRSASRVGRSDMGANRQRVERLRARFAALTQQ